MIHRLTGVLATLTDEEAFLSAGFMEFVVRIPEFTRRRLQSQLGQEVSLYTILTLDGNPQGKMTPRLIGFLSEVEREFFELFCSVDGVGGKKALRAMVRPVQEIAAAIEEQDVKSLSSLPGIGAATAEKIVAKLRRKVPKFALLVTRDQPHAAIVAADVVSDTFQVLCNLGHSESEARHLLDRAMETKRKYPDVQSLLTAIYDQRKTPTQM
ncbi:MAG: Holliday junction branch migration protein RuvA [Planctomycetia bacterium]|nr:Holliday junction branch migration protein RuvA [Planctomycetia bacterium]